MINLPDTFFPDLIRSQNLIIVDSKLYILYPYNKRRDYLSFYGKKLSLEPSEGVSLLDKLYFKHHGKDIKSQLESMLEHETYDATKKDPLRAGLKAYEEYDLISMIVKQAIPHYLTLQQTRRRSKDQEMHAQAKPEVSMLSLDVCSYTIAKQAFQGKKMLGFMGTVFGLSEFDKTNKEFVSIKKKKYSIIPSNPSAVSDIESEYKQKIKEHLEHILTQAKEKTKGKLSSTDEKIIQYADAGKYEHPCGAGFEKIDTKIYFYAKVPSFALYEPVNDSYYQFPDARVAVEIARSDDQDQPLRWSEPIILEQYTHPGLHYSQVPMQEICVGNADSEYAKMREASKEDPSKFAYLAASLLKKVSDQIQRGYIRGDINGPWHSISNDAEMFEHLKTTVPINVTNR